MISEHIERGSFRTALRFGLKRHTHEKRELTVSTEYICLTSSPARRGPNQPPDMDNAIRRSMTAATPLLSGRLTTTRHRSPQQLLPPFICFAIRMPRVGCTIGGCRPKGGGGPSIHRGQLGVLDFVVENRYPDSQIKFRCHRSTSVEIKF